jgi:hypothetical protein
VARADRQVTPAQRELLGRLRATIGAETWSAAVRAARDRYTSIEQLERARARRGQAPAPSPPPALAEY